MKTAMQELLNELDIIKIVEKHNFFMVNYIINQLLEKEKEQIIFAYNDGVNDGNTQGLLGKKGNGNYSELYEYYNQTYNQNNNNERNNTDTDRVY
jgi:hypothetical protein